ncbi:AfsR/SARP family transcriptional regulator [Deinococcus irradiatisoli]|uniref:AfsR/SARP family transcriptional regulator n=1 Tax=Deinococcus irradiatisoli TaxID=2202254 RepID=UPI0015E848C4|nr:BTAD domain-containing putative transcriptional regulator [Deinococcus irradiatisoli]
MTGLQIHTFGFAHTDRDGQRVHWESGAARDVLHYLLCFPAGRRREELLSDLWNTDDERGGKNRFRVTLHRLRAALARPDAVIEDDGRYALHPEVLGASDVGRFYSALSRFERAGDPQQRRAALEQATGLYRGDFLSGQTAGWVNEAREEHQAAYVRANLELSLLRCDARECQASAQSLASALHTDPFVGENYHQRLMACVSRVEGKYAATEHYRRFAAFLSEQLGDTPMPETVDLAQRIKCGEAPCFLETAPHQGLAQPVAGLCPLLPGSRCSQALSEALQLN